ncbi:MAG: hypothetical protein LBD92_03180 [Oscillospiraceae bacterium]|jgi:hypothetical protein|nr:hypothetical protein [Oscillospiraceae bacterium]
MRKRKMWLKVSLGALGALILAAAVVAATLRENIRAFVVSRSFTREELEEKLEEREADTAKILEKLPEVSVRQPTEEEKEQLRRGDMSAEEAAGRLLSPPARETSPDPADSGVGETEGGESRAPPNAEAAAPARAAALIAEVYILRETMTGQIDGILDAAKAEYTALPEEDRTSAKKREIAARYIGEVSKLEKTCDARMGEIIGELEAVLKETGGDTSAAADIKQAYEEEKSLKKSYFLSRYS